MYQSLYQIQAPKRYQCCQVFLYRACIVLHVTHHQILSACSLCRSIHPLMQPRGLSTRRPEEKAPQQLSNRSKICLPADTAAEAGTPNSDTGAIVDTAKGALSKAVGKSVSLESDAGEAIQNCAVIWSCLATLFIHCKYVIQSCNLW